MPHKQKAEREERCQGRVTKSAARPQISAFVADIPPVCEDNAQVAFDSPASLTGYSR